MTGDIYYIYIYSSDNEMFIKQYPKTNWKNFKNEVTIMNQKFRKLFLIKLVILQKNI